MVRSVGYWRRDQIPTFSTCAVAIENSLMATADRIITAPPARPPPFGYALFYLRGIAPEGVTIGTIYRGVIPFVVLQLLGLTAVVLWPQITLWLPSYLSQ